MLRPHSLVTYTGDMPNEEPWYKDGLCFSCTQCGNCCTGAPGVVWVDEQEIERIADFLGQTVGEIRLFHTRLLGRRVSLREYANGDCTFFDPKTRKCSVYPIRPKQCRTWPFWKSNLESPRHWRDVQTTCPGAGNGEFFSLEEIEAQASTIDV